MDLWSVACFSPGMTQTEPDVAGHALFGHEAGLLVPALFLSSQWLRHRHTAAVRG